MPLLESLSAAPIGSGFLAGKQVAFWFRRLLSQSSRSPMCLPRMTIYSEEFCHSSGAHFALLSAADEEKERTWVPFAWARRPPGPPAEELSFRGDINSSTVQ